jgi:hypothetical protein
MSNTLDRAAWDMVAAIASVESGTDPYVALLVHQARRLLQQRRLDERSQRITEPRRRNIWKELWR